jgi:hypothetical protein
VQTALSDHFLSLLMYMFCIIIYFIFLIHLREPRSSASPSPCLFAPNLDPLALPPPPSIIVTATMGCCVRLSARNTATNGAFISPRSRACRQNNQCL